MPRVTIEWKRDRHPVAGDLTAGSAPAQAFIGWLELLALLQRAYAAAPDDTPTSTPKEKP